MKKTQYVTVWSMRGNGRNDGNDFQSSRIKFGQKQTHTEEGENIPAIPGIPALGLQMFAVVPHLAERRNCSVCQNLLVCAAC
jgi:hypothetical protein